VKNRRHLAGYRGRKLSAGGHASPDGSSFN
jgi:hypothetical protein